MQTGIKLKPLAPWLIAAVLVFASTPAHAWLRMGYEDAVVVERSELIVVGYIKKDSITYVPHDRKPTDGRSWEHHATLVITKVLKGKLDEKEIPIIIHYGIDPLIGGRSLHDPDARPIAEVVSGKTAPADEIDLVDHGGHGGEVLRHAEQDNLWFLRRRSGIYGREPGTGNFGIVDPQDTQPLEHTDYIKAYLREDPETAVKEYVNTHPAFASRAQSYFDHLDVQRSLKIQDANVRATQLVPYFLKLQYWSGARGEAATGLVACGEAAGPLLLTPFNDPTFEKRRGDIMRLWGDIHYKPVVELLVKLLLTADKFWAEQDLKGDWWNDVVNNPKVTERRRQVYGDVYDAVIALRRIGDIRAVEAITLTAKRWRSVGFNNHQILDECEGALKELGSQK